MRILGIDPGIKNCGWGVIDADGPPRYVAAGVIKPKDDGAGHGERLLSVGRQVARLIGEYEPQAVAMERAGRSANLQSETQWIIGHLLAVVARAGLMPSLYYLSAVKKRVTGTGRATKAQVASEVWRALGRDGPVANHAADALAVALVLAEDLDVDQAG